MRMATTIRTTTAPDRRTDILEFGAGEGPRLLVKLGLENPGGAGTFPGPALLARITRQSRDRLGLTLGQRIYAQVKAAALME